MGHGPVTVMVTSHKPKIFPDILTSGIRLIFTLIYSDPTHTACCCCARRFPSRRIVGVCASVCLCLGSSATKGVFALIHSSKKNICCCYLFCETEAQNRLIDSFSDVRPQFYSFRGTLFPRTNERTSGVLLLDYHHHGTATTSKAQRHDKDDENVDDNAPGLLQAHPDSSARRARSLQESVRMI